MRKRKKDWNPLNCIIPSLIMMVTWVDLVDVQTVRNRSCRQKEKLAVAAQDSTEYNN